jgi:phosphatidylserine/phosphatidylglycerophosphate/cardiolipin synthase-like enzyme
MADFARGKIQAYVGPPELGAENDLETVVCRFIDEAEKTLDIAVQELDSEKIAQALLDARYRGVGVRMFMEQDYLKAKKPPRPKATGGMSPAEALRYVQWHEPGRGGRKSNREILTALLRCGIDVKSDLNPAIFHQKFIVRDFRNHRSRGNCAVLTGSTNFTWTGTHKNLNHLVVFNDPRVARVYGERFTILREGTFGSLRTRHHKVSPVMNLEGVPVRIRFAPDDAPELEIVKQMLKCSHRLDFAVFTFAGSSGIDDALLMLHRAGVKINGVLDGVQGRQAWAASTWLHNMGMNIYLSDRTKMPGLGKLHHKLMVIDEDIVVAGSMNYTAPANERNDENICVLGSPYDLPDSKGGPVDHDECRAIAAFFRSEIERITDKSTRFTPDRGTT